MSAHASLLAAADALRSTTPLPPDDLAPCLALADEITALLRARSAPSPAVAAEPKRPVLASPPVALALCDLPTELLAQVVYHLATTEDVGRLHLTCLTLNRPKPPPPPPPTAVEEGLRLRAAARGIRTVEATELEAGETLTQEMCWAEQLERCGGRATVAAGNYHHVLVDAQGRLLTCGIDGNDTGCLGHGATLELAVPTPVPGLAGVRVRSVSAGCFHTLAVSDGGVAYSFGEGRHGKLGHGDEENQMQPRVIEALRDVWVHAVAAGSAHSLALSDRGALYSFGWGDGGRLGHGDRENQLGDQEDQLTPKVVAALQGVRICVVAAGDHSLVVSDKGVVFSFGRGENGKLGHGDTAPQFVPKAIQALRGVRVRAVAAGFRHSLAVSDAGVLYSFGEGCDGRLGHGDRMRQIKPKVVVALQGVRVSAVAAGHSHSLVLSEQGVVYSMGSASFGQIGHGDQQSHVLPKAIEGLPGVRVCEVAAGEHTSLAVAMSGAVYGWGSGQDLGLGLGEGQNQQVPLRYPEVRGLVPL